MPLILTDGDVYVHIDDHTCNVLTWEAIYQWSWSLIPSNQRKRIWHSRVEVIPLRHFKGNFKMVARRGKQAQTVTTDGFIGFVNISLSEDELALVDKEMLDKKVLQGMPGHIDYLMELGKCTFNYVNGSVNVTLTVLEGEMVGFAVSAFSDSVIEALLLVRMKVQNYLPQFRAIYEKGGSRSRRG